MNIINSLKVAAMLLLSSFGYAHAQSDSIKTNLTYKSQIKFSLTACVYDNIQMDWFDVKILKSNPMPSGEVSISYYNCIKNGYGFNIGLGMGLAPLNLNFKFNPPQNSVFQTGPHKEDYKTLDYNHNEYVQEFYTLPLSFQKTFYSKKNNAISCFIEAGLKLNYKVAYPYSITGGSVYGIDDTTEARLFQFTLRNTPHRTIVSYFFKYGWQKLLKKQNTFQYGFVLHYSPSKIGAGSYEFSNLPYYSYGNVFQNINYIGFEVIYGLTTSRRIRDR